MAVSSHFRGRPGGICIELGEAITAGFDLANYLAPIAATIDVAEADLLTALRDVRTQPAEQVPALEARLLYQWLLGLRSYRAVDLGSNDPEAWIDLNYPIDLGTRYDLMINNGTSEHVFNQANVFKFMHDHTKIGGTMIHYTTGLGWVEHGFYNLQPSFFFDLAKYNGYRVLSCALVNEAISLELQAGEINGDNLNADPRLRNALLHCVLRRTDDAAFRYPIQRPYQPSH